MNPRFKSMLVVTICALLTIFGSMALLPHTATAQTVGTPLAPNFSDGGSDGGSAQLQPEVAQKFDSWVIQTIQSHVTYNSFVPLMNAISNANDYVQCGYDIAEGLASYGAAFSPTTSDDCFPITDRIFNILNNQ